MSSHPTPVLAAPGSLPPAWEHSGVFVANLLSLFFGNREQTAALCREVGRLETYGGRLLPVLGLLYQGEGPNLVLLEAEPDDTLQHYFRDDLGLAVPEIGVLPHEDYLVFAAKPSSPTDAMRIAIDRIRDRVRADAKLDGFVTDEALEIIAREAGVATVNHLQGSYHGNHKVELHEHLVAHDLPVFDTHLALKPSAMSRALRDLATQGYSRAAVKSAIGASGIGIWQLSTADPEPTATVPDFAFSDGPCLVQGWIDPAHADVEAVHSPSAQLMVRDESVHLYDLTDQILSDQSVHQGNMAPPQWLWQDDASREELLHQSAVVGRWLHGCGYRGTASIDFHVADRADRREIRVCEVNARVTGATYPALLARHFNPQGAWLMRNVRIKPSTPPVELLRALDRAGLLYRPGQDKPLLPINFNTDESGRVVKGQFLSLAPDPDSAHDQLQALHDHLPMAESFDRD